MARGGQTTLTPTESGQKVLSYCMEKSGSIAQAARDANVPEATLRRRIFYAPPGKLALTTVLRLERYGLQRGWLNLAQ